MSRNFVEIKSSLNFQILDAIITAIAEKVLPSIKNTLDTQSRANFTVVDRGSSGIQVGPRTANSTVVDRGSSGLQVGPRMTDVTVWTEGPVGYTWAQGRLISAGRTEVPVCYNGTPKLRKPRKRGKIAPKRVLRMKIVDECLERVLLYRLLYKRAKPRQ